MECHYWKGELGSKRGNSPSDEVFKSQFENLPNPKTCNYADMTLTVTQLHQQNPGML